MVDDAKCGRESMARCLHARLPSVLGAPGRHGRALSKGGAGPALGPGGNKLEAGRPGRRLEAGAGEKTTAESS